MVSSQRAPTRSRESPRPLIARTSRVPKDDLLRFLAQHAGEPRFYYRSRGFALAGVGIAAEVVAHGSDRFERVRDETARVLTTLGTEKEPGVPASVGPVWIGGFSFETDVGGGDGQAFPSARFVLPKVQLRTQADGTYRTTVGTTGEKKIVQISGPAKASAVAPNWTSGIDEAEWSRRVRSALHEIQAGNAEKVVLARSLQAEFSETPELSSILGRLQAITPQSTVFLIEPEAQHAWIGASPELLVRRSQTRLETAALAGSRPRGRTPDEDMAFERNLRASSKEAWEHELVCRFLRSAFEELGREARVTQDRGVLKLPNVQHLETRFEAPSAPGEHVLDIAARFHPTPAVSGMPRDKSLAMIKDLEGERGWYAGAIGIFDHAGEGELVVGIRSAHVHGRKVILTAGCGIVNGSDPVEEWNESDVKFQVARRAFDVTRPA